MESVGPYLLYICIHVDRWSTHSVEQEALGMLSGPDLVLSCHRIRGDRWNTHSEEH